MARNIRGAASGGVNQFGPVNRTRTQPIPVTKSRRVLDFRNLTTLQAGKSMPILAFPLLREDGCSAKFRINAEMMETVELLANAVSFRVMAYLVPNLAFKRFGGSMDALNRAYTGTVEIDGTGIIPYFATANPGSAPESLDFWKYMGIHFQHADTATPPTINLAYMEAYRCIWNFRAKNRSLDIPQVVEDGYSATTAELLPAFWVHQTMAHIVPDWDQASMEGEVPLNVVDGALPIVGMGWSFPQGVAGGGTATETAIQYIDTTGATVNTTGFLATGDASAPAAAGTTILGMEAGGPVGARFPQVFAEMAENGITVSLSNIELARKTQAFALLRRQFSGHTDDYIIDLLMQGIRVPDQAWAHPILLADKTTVFGMSKRYASDSVDLTASVVNGGTFLDLSVRCPPCPTGGVIMLIAEAMPEQLWERKKDPYMTTVSTATLPDFLRDTLDPEKVEIVPNDYVDVMHSTPDGVFGYAPLNHQWATAAPRIGGKFFRPNVDTPVDEDRMRFWASETLNPTLSTDFYLVTDLNLKPFVVTDGDPFECVTRGQAVITGNTVFGRLLLEASDDYEDIMSQVPMDRLENPPASTTTTTASPPLVPGADDLE